MKDEMTPYERTMAVLNGQQVDRVPVAPIIRYWCAGQARVTFSELVESASKWTYCQYYSAKMFGMDVLWDFFGINAEAEAQGQRMGRRRPKEFGGQVDLKPYLKLKSLLFSTKEIDFALQGAGLRNPSSSMTRSSFQ